MALAVTVLPWYGMSEDDEPERRLTASSGGGTFEDDEEPEHAHSLGLGSSSSIAFTGGGSCLPDDGGGERGASIRRTVDRIVDDLRYGLSSAGTSRTLAACAGTSRTGDVDAERLFGLLETARERRDFLRGFRLMFWTNDK